MLTSIFTINHSFNCSFYSSIWKPSPLKTVVMPYFIARSFLLKLFSRLFSAVCSTFSWLTHIFKCKNVNWLSSLTVAFSSIWRSTPSNKVVTPLPFSSSLSLKVFENSACCLLIGFFCDDDIIGWIGDSWMNTLIVHNSIHF